MQSHRWKDNKPKLIINQKYNLSININRESMPISYLLPNKTRTLVGIATNLSNNNKEIMATIQQKSQEYLVTLTSCNLPPCNIMERYDKFW